jgi:hypothetical protein
MLTGSSALLPLLPHCPRSKRVREDRAGATLLLLPPTIRVPPRVSLAVRTGAPLGWCAVICRLGCDRVD